MEKIVQICKRFELNVDDLLNKDIREVKGEQESKNNLNKYIDDFLHFITDTVNLLSDMSFRTKIKCLFEQLLIMVVVAFVLIILGFIGSSIINSIFYGLLPFNIYTRVFDILVGIYLVFSLIVTIVILAHIFKTRYLDYYKNIKREVDNSNNNTATIVKENVKVGEKDAHKNKILFKKNEDKIIIRDPKHSEYKFINGVFKLIVLFVKFFALVGALFLCILLVMFFAGFIMAFSIIKTGLFFVGFVLCMLSLSVLTIVIILLLLNFVFSRKNDKKKMIWTFIVSVIILGISCGLTFLGALKFDIIEDKENEMVVTKSLEIDMKDDLVFMNYNTIEYIEKDMEYITIEYDCNKYCELNYDTYETIDEKNKRTLFHFWGYCPNGFALIRNGISELNQNKIISISDQITNVKIYTSKENIEKLKENRKQYDLENNTRENMYNNYEERINELEDELEIKQSIIDDLQDEIDNFEYEVKE